eukprot:9453895-Ditylum_brightwellii.AAC.1
MSPISHTPNPQNQTQHERHCSQQTRHHLNAIRILQSLHTIYSMQCLPCQGDKKDNGERHIHGRCFFGWAESAFHGQN